MTGRLRTYPQFMNLENLQMLQYQPFEISMLTKPLIYTG